jgi:ferredoxin
LTPEYGPRQRFQAILTDAPLEPTPMPESAVCDGCRACMAACPLGAWDPAADRAVTVAGKSAIVAGIDYGQCRKCRNGAQPNPHHPAGRPDRLAGLCVRTCVAHLEESGRVGNRFAGAFRRRPPWQVDAMGNASLQGDR